jgi:phosphoglycolate phosphatase-like HAD superfamily hydrolase
MVGDQPRDIEMAQRAGLRSVLVKTGGAGRDGQFTVAADHVVDDFAAASGVILQQKEFLPE